MLVEERPIDSIRPYENNPRHNDAGVDAVAKSLQAYGWRQPLVVDEDGVIIVGHTRFKAALKLGIKRFDLRVLYAEFQRAGLTFNLEGRAIIDPMVIFHHYERRDLGAAVRFYLGRNHENGHAAESDVAATADVLMAMLDRYEELPRTVTDLHKMFVDPNAVDLGERFMRLDGEIRFKFGQYRQQPLDAIARIDPRYLEWLLKQDFEPDAKRLISEALAKNQSAGTNSSQMPSAIVG